MLNSMITSGENGGIMKDAEKDIDKIKKQKLSYEKPLLSKVQMFADNVLGACSQFNECNPPPPSSAA